MAYARDHGWVILTQDLDFGTILAVTHGEKPSVIQIRSEDVSPEDPRRTRLRYLPLHSRTDS